METDKRDIKAGFEPGSEIDDENEMNSSHSEIEAVENAGRPPEDHEKAAMDAITHAKREAETAQKEILYLRAEFENYKKRIIKEQSDAIRLANRNFISDALGIVDLLDRALQHSGAIKSKGDADLKNFVTGIEMTRGELTQLLVRFGVEFVGTEGEKFDPERHEAISQREAEDGLVDHVLEVFQKGCLLHGKLLKPARVVVGTAKKA